MILLLAACAPPAGETNAAPEGAVASLWTAETRTVLAGDNARALARQCSRVSPGPVESVWTPNDAQLERLEDQLIVVLSQRLEAAGLSPSPGDYYRQYAGFVIAGRRVIYVNGVARSAIQNDHAFDWRSRPVSICDGGPITFGAEYDVATRQFSDFAFNGAI
jgi:hypothetical protein